MLFIILWSLEGGVRGWEEMDCTFPQPTMLGGVCVCVFSACTRHGADRVSASDREPGRSAQLQRWMTAKRTRPDHSRPAGPIRRERWWTEERTPSAMCSTAMWHRPPYGF